MDGFNGEVIWTAKRIGMKPNEIVQLSCGEYYAYFEYEMLLHKAEMAQYEKGNSNTFTKYNED